jgi:hypothetical protein
VKAALELYKTLQIPGADTLHIRNLSQCPWSVYEHRGGYEGLASAWSLAMELLSKRTDVRGDLSRGVDAPYEHYMTEITTPNEQHVTLICWPVVRI